MAPTVLPPSTKSDPVLSPFISFPVGASDVSEVSSGPLLGTLEKPNDIETPNNNAESGTLKEETGNEYVQPGASQRYIKRAPISIPILSGAQMAEISPSHFSTAKTNNQITFATSGFGPDGQLRIIHSKNMTDLDHSVKAVDSEEAVPCGFTLPYHFVGFFILAFLVISIMRTRSRSALSAAQGKAAKEFCDMEKAENE